MENTNDDHRYEGLHRCPPEIKPFGEHAEKYFEQGLCVIPIMRHGKNPTIEGWQKYSNEQPTLAEINSWLHHYYGSNIGLVCGPASGVIVIDIDCDELVKDKRIPTSPIVRRGHKGECRFFKYRPGLENVKREKIELFVTGCQVLLPPSWHAAAGRQYEWNGASNGFDYDILPELPGDIMKIMDGFKGRQSSGPVNTGDSGGVGRNNKIKTILAACYSAGKTIEESIQEILDYDEKHHKPQLFTDPSEPYWKKGERNRLGAATVFAKSMYKGMEIKIGPQEKQDSDIKIAGVDFEVGETLSESEDELFQNDKAAMFGVNKEPPPKPRHENIFASELYDILESNCDQYAPTICLGTTLAACAALTGNRFFFADSESGYRYKTPTNLFVFVVAPSGTGKDLIKSIHPLFHKLKIIGRGGYQSGAAVWHDIAKNRTKIDLIDEASQFFNKLCAKGKSHQTEILEAVNTIFNSNYSSIPSSISAQKNGQTESTIYWPSLTLLGATTHDMFKREYQSHLVTSGFMGRSLFLGQFETNLVDSNLIKPRDISELSEFVAEFHCEFPIIGTGKRITLDDVDLYKEAKILKFEGFGRAWWEEQRIISQQLKEKFKHSPQSGIVARRLELIFRIATADAALSRQAGVSEVNLIWAESVWEWCYRYIAGEIDGLNSSAMLNEQQKLFSRNTNEIYDRLFEYATHASSRKDGLIYHSDFYRWYNKNKTDRLQVMEYKKLIQELVLQDRIEVTPPKHKNAMFGEYKIKHFDKLRR